MTSQNSLVTIALITVIISAISLGVTYFTISHLANPFTGYVTYSYNATVNVTVQGVVALNFSTSNINFGTGSVTPPYWYAVLTSSGVNSNGTGFTPPSTGLVLENIGSTNVTLSLKTGKNATGLLAGNVTFRSYQFNITNSEAGSCKNSTDFNLGAYYDVNITDPGTLVCDVFGYDDTRDTLRIDIRLVIPYDSNNGSLGDQISAVATGQ